MKKSPSYLFQLIPPNNSIYATRSSQSNKISSFKTRHNYFKDSFFATVISEWNSLDINIRNSSSINVFKKEPNQNQTLFIISMIPKDQNYLQDCGLDSVTCVITNSGITSKTVYPQYVAVVRILKQQLTSPFTAPIIIVQGKPSFTR